MDWKGAYRASLQYLYLYSFNAYWDCYHRSQ